MGIWGHFLGLLYNYFLQDTAPCNSLGVVQIKPFHPAAIELYIDYPEIRSRQQCSHEFSVQVQLSVSNM